MFRGYFVSYLLVGTSIYNPQIRLVNCRLFHCRKRWLMRRKLTKWLTVIYWLVDANDVQYSRVLFEVQLKNVNLIKAIVLFSLLPPPALSGQKLLYLFV